MSVWVVMTFAVFATEMFPPSSILSTPWSIICPSTLWALWFCDALCSAAFSSSSRALIFSSYSRLTACDND